MSPLRRSALVALALTLGCSDAPATSTSTVGPGSAAPGVGSGAVVPGAALAAVSPSGRELLERYQCNRCHQGTGLPDADPTKSCVGCHKAIAANTFKADARSLAEWRPRVVPLRFAPSLSAVGPLVSKEWVRSYLLSPFDVRPALHPTMPRLPLSEAEAGAIAEYLAGLPHEAPPDELPPGDVGRGRALFEAKGCGACHRFGGAGVKAPATMDPTQAAERVLAPDLRFARQRLVRAHLVAYLLSPSSIKPDAAMPPQTLDRAEAVDLVAFLWETPLEPEPPLATSQRLPLLTRPVGYDEVAERVLHRTCWHCHSQPDYARGDGGPGNTGGFGFAPRRLDLSSYESVAGGYLDASGQRRSVFQADGDRPAPLVEALLVRQRELVGERGPVRGMPLGLPALSPEDIQLVESWVEQGHPR